MVNIVPFADADAVKCSACGGREFKSELK